MNNPIKHSPSSHHELRQFGLTFGGMVAIVFGGLLPWFFNFAHPFWPWPVCAVFVTTALLAPRLLGWFYHRWMVFAGLLGHVNTTLILLLVFTLLFVPIGLVIRLAQFLRATLTRSSPASYRVPRDPIDPSSMENPF